MDLVHRIYHDFVFGGMKLMYNYNILENKKNIPVRKYGGDFSIG